MNTMTVELSGPSNNMDTSSYPQQRTFMSSEFKLKLWLVHCQVLCSNHLWYSPSRVNKCSDKIYSVIAELKQKSKYPQFWAKSRASGQHLIEDRNWYIMQCERHNQEKCGLNCRDEYDVKKLVYSVIVVASIVVNEVKEIENTFLFLHLLILYL